MLSLQSRKYSLLPVQSCEFSKGIKLVSSFSFKPDTSLSVALGIKLLLFFFFHLFLCEFAAAKFVYAYSHFIYAICSFIYACMSAVEMYMGTHVAF